MPPIKPGMWAVSPAEIDPQYLRFWRDLLGAWAMWSTNPFDLTRQANTSQGGGETLGPSKYGTALIFDGGGTTLQAPAPNFDLPDKQHFSCMALASRDAGTNEDAIFRTNDLGDDANVWFSLVYTGTNDLQPRFEIRDSSPAWHNTLANEVAYGDMHLIVGTFDEGTLKIYVDGVEENENATAGSTLVTPVSTPELAWGWYDAQASLLDGKLALTAAWNRTLSPADIGLLQLDPFGFIRPAPLFPSGLTVDLFATADGSIVDVVNELDAASPLWSSVDDDPDTPTDTDWINNAVDV